MMTSLYNKRAFWAAQFGIAICGVLPTFADRTISESVYLDKLHGMWLGQLIAIETGLAPEGLYWWDTIPPDSSYVWVTRAEWPADDASDIEYLIEHVLRENGINPSPEQLRDEWLEHVPAESVFFGNRIAAYLLQAGLLPPETGSHHRNIDWWAIDPMLTTEAIGAMSPGLRGWAVDFTGQWSHITTTGTPVHASQFYAAMYSAAAFESDVETLIDKGLESIPTSSRAADIVRKVRDWYLADIADGTPDWRTTRYRIFEHYVGPLSFGRFYHWVQGDVNFAATVMALLYGGGSYEETVRIAVLAGWDTDCNASAAGGLIGMIVGYGGLPGFLTAQCGDVYLNNTRPGLPVTDSVLGFAQRLCDLAVPVLISQGGFVTGTSPNCIFHVPDADPVTPEPEMPLASGPAGLVGAFRAIGQNVVVRSNIALYLTAYDRLNLLGIVDGVVEPTYSGHKPYWTDDGDPAPPASGDWYEIEFPRSVRLDRVVFWEGDAVFFVLGNPLTAEYEGGYFDSLVVEVRRNGVWQPATVMNQSEPLNQRIAYQRIAYQLRPTICEAFRIRGPAGGTRHFTTIMELEAFGSIPGQTGPSREVLPISVHPFP